MKIIHPHLILSILLLPAFFLSLPLITSSCNRGQTHTSTENSKNSATTKTAKSYPLQTCLVSGDTLGGMGKAISINYQGQEIKLCCKKCISKFKSNPKRYLARLSPHCTDQPTLADHHHDNDLDDHTHGTGESIQFLDDPFNQNTKD